MAYIVRPLVYESFIDVPRWRRGTGLSFDLGKFHFESGVIRVGYDYHRNQSAAQQHQRRRPDTGQGIASEQQAQIFVPGLVEPAADEKENG